MEVLVPAGCVRVLGRRPEQVDVCIPNRTITGRHARVFERAGLWYVEDLGSKSGVYVNDAPTRGVQPITTGDIIRLGTVELEVSVSTDA